LSQYTINGDLCGEVGHGAGKRWKIRVQTGLSLFVSARPHQVKRWGEGREAD